MVFRKHLSAQCWRTVGAVLLMLSHFIGPGSAYVVVVDRDLIKSAIFQSRLAADGGHGQWTYRWANVDPVAKKLFHLSTTDGAVRLKRNGLIKDHFCSDWPLEIEASAGNVKVSVPLTVKLQCGSKTSSANDRVSENRPLPESGRRLRVTHNLPRIHDQLDSRQFNEICWRRSELILAGLAGYLPTSLMSNCGRPHDWTVVDGQTLMVGIEARGIDLVSLVSDCHPGTFVNIPLRFELSDCGGSEPEQMDVTIRLPDDVKERRHRRRRTTPSDSSFSFDRPLYVTSVAEERDRGLPVITAQVNNPPASGVSYSMVAVLDARSQKLFSIDSQSGSISTAARLDRESMDVHYLRVTATETSMDSSSGASLRSATTTVQINVEDVNDYPPTFEQPAYETTVRESASIGSAVLTVRAKDADAGANADVHYSLVNPFGANEAFRIDAKTGVISTRLALDRETIDQYNLTVQAVDQGQVQERQSATTSVRITLVDENDNYPQFTERTYTVEVPENVNFADNPVIARIRYVRTNSKFFFN